MITQARFLTRDVLEVHRPGAGGPTVVLLHGLYATAGVFAPLRRRLEDELSASTHSFSYAPGPGVNELTERLAALLAKIESDLPIHLVGHSLGGLVARNYVLSADRDSRVVRTISLASPYCGSHRSWLVPGQAGRDLQSDSHLLRQLRTRDAAGVFHFSVLAADDGMVIGDSRPAFGEIAVLNDVGHNGILFDSRAQDLVLRCIAGRCLR